MQRIYIHFILILAFRIGETVQQPIDWKLKTFDNETVTTTENSATIIKQIKQGKEEGFIEPNSPSNVTKPSTKENNSDLLQKQLKVNDTKSEFYLNENSSNVGNFEHLMQQIKRMGKYSVNFDLTDYYSFKKVNFANGDVFVPEAWGSFCNVKIGKYNMQIENKSLVLIKCNVSSNDEWDFVSYRNFTSILNDTNLDFALDIECSPKAVISLPWPMRANLLKYISVKDCTIENYKKEIYDQTLNSIPDTLNYVRFENTQALVNMDELLERAKNPKTITQAADCGPAVAYITIMKNVSHKFDLTKTIPSLKHFPLLAKSTKKMFRDLSRVKYTCTYRNMWILDRSFCTTMGVHTDMFLVYNSKFPKLEVLNLTHTLMNKIPEKLKEWRLHLPALNYLDLTHNKIYDFSVLRDYGGELENPVIGTIDLRYNDIKLITAKDLRVLARSKYYKVDLRNNPYDCVCEMRHFVDSIRVNPNFTSRYNATSYNYFNNLICTSPEQLSGRVISKLTNEDLGCQLNTTTVLIGPIIILSGFVTILLLLLLFMVRYRKEITILAFTRLNIIFPCHGGSLGEKKEYDVFIAYSKFDIEWVLKTLAPKLENSNNPNNFKVCLHDRDFALGAPISDNIIKSVETSRHTLLVISKQFLKSEWCLLEFRTALQQSLLEKKRHLIMILLEDIPTDEIDNDIKRCLQTLTYVKADDRWFWDKLIYALSDKTRKKKNRKEININQQARRDHVNREEVVRF